ncbi:hypothetical protein [Arcobacter sp.]|uniref:hypothetical protein n=1 Tax=Arcobacter sp. TaxID=1872629 RepID=UPI003D149B02
MNYEITKINDFTECCFVYIDEINDSLEKLVIDNLIEIVRGKLEAERTKDTKEFKETFLEAAKFIFLKKNKEFRIGIIGELLFHALLRIRSLESKFVSLCPTIGYSEAYGKFYTGFDGCYHSSEGLWISEVKSKLNVINLDKDNYDKVAKASGQIKNEVMDEEINRWDKAKQHVRHQFSELELEEKSIYNLLKKENKTNYNQLIGTFLICEKEKFSKEYIRTYCNSLQHMKNQKIFLICMRSFDYELIIKFIENKANNNYV